MNTTVGIFSNHVAAESAINELKAFGVPDQNISYIYSDIDGKLIDAQAPTKVGEGAAVGVTAGAALGALAGAVVASGVLPGFGALIVAGPLATALGITGATAVAGAATGAVAGGLLGALANFGITAEDALLYETYVKRGDILVIIRSNSFSVRDVFNKSGASEIREYPYPLVS